MKNINVSAVKAKREFTEILGRVSVGRETFTITRHGKPVAVLAPTAPAKGLQALKGWLETMTTRSSEIFNTSLEREKNTKSAGFVSLAPLLLE